MSLEDFTPVESSEGVGQSTEISEKFKEAFKKGSAGIKRTQKDEKKAKKHDVLLAGFLVKIIIDKRYDALLASLFICLHEGYPSNFLLGILSLIEIKISDHIRERSEKEKINFHFISEQQITFNDSYIPEEVKNRINAWVEDIIDIVSIEYSTVMTENLLKNLKDRNSVLQFTSQIFGLIGKIVC